MLKPDRWIIEMAEKHSMIEPFERENVRQVNGYRVFSYGVQPYGYDLRLSKRFLVPHPIGNVMDSKNKQFDEVYARVNAISIPPKEYVIGFSIEKIKMPRGITGLIYGKLSLAETGILVNATPVDAGFDGVLRLCIVNLNSVPIRIYPLEGIAQILFFEGDSLPEKDYKEKGGNYGKKAD